MCVRAVLSLLLAFALAFVPLAPAFAVSTASAESDVTAHAGHDRSAAHAHDAMTMQTDAPAPDCADHADCKGSCCAHCVSVPLPAAQTAVDAKPIQTGAPGKMRLTFNSDTPSRPPRIIL